MSRRRGLFAVTFTYGRAFEFKADVVTFDIADENHKNRCRRRFHRFE
ncbi:MAG: hypothetical protein GY757_42520 [bacterium]|nr:hypothetical protein [bacterium]